MIMVRESWVDLVLQVQHRGRFELVMLKIEDHPLESLELNQR